jgi:prepilin-type N-terminal cleavage/methylation domain-containing protein
MSKLTWPAKRQRRQKGFTLLELMIAILVMLVGVVSVAQLVPAAMWLNNANREDSSSAILAQRQLDEFVDQALTATSYVDPDPNGPCYSNTCNLGSTSSFNTVIGNNVISLNGHAAIDFSGSPTSGYGYYYHDPEDTTGAYYDVRWAAISTGTAGTVSSKRFILGVRKKGGETPLLPITLETTVSK